MGKKKSKTKTTTTPWAPMQPYILGAASDMSNIVKQNQPKLDQLAGGITAKLPELQSIAFGPNPTLQAGNQYAQDVLGGKYLNSNPYQEAMAHQGEQDAGNAVNSAYSLAGRTGGGASQQALARGVAQAGNQVRFGQYNQERANQQNAAAMIPGLAQAQVAGFAPWLAATELAGKLPYAGTSSLGGLLGMGAGAGTTTGTQPGGWGTALLGAASGALPFIPGISDRRLKKNIEKVGEAEDGLGIYEFEYRFDPEGRRYRGPMADEVEKLRPWAFIPNFRGEFHGVNYAYMGDLR